jgi:diguanylate cyclase (GGDEF)-like protein
MFVGNVIVGLVVVSLVDRDPRWLLLLPPALWLLQQTYGHRLRADDERRAWQEFATGIGDLNRLDEREVAAAAVSHSLRLFGAERVELDVLRSDGVVRRYTGDSAGERADTEAHERSSSAEGESTLVRRLSVADVQVGELRVELPRATLPSPRDELALNAFAEALAAALHDSAAHRELGIVKGIAAYEAVHDQLTSLHSRTAMLARGDEVLCGLEHGTPVALVLIDVNRFRDVNDTLGHAAGDELLQALADRLGTLVDGDDVLGRMGGDEFALLITATPEPAPQAAIGNRDDAQPAALRKARALVEQLAHPVEVQGVRMSVEASAGVVVAGAGTVGMTELLRRADVALYQAKDGGSSVAWYDSSRDVASTDQLALLAELREALAVDDQLYLVLQPAVDLSTGEPTGVEALIRWRHPRRNNLMPAEFVRAAEGSEMVGLFTRYVIDKALEVAADIVAHDMTVPISVNLSAQSLLDPTLPADINELLRRHGVPSNQLVVEITETVVLRELDVVDEVLGALRQMGVRLAVDDFGTGFSSLSFLDRIEVDELKVDRSFVMRMGESPQAAAIVQSIVELGHRMHLRVVAEGVETAAQRAALVDLGCSAAQGYHFFKPMPADKIVTVLGELLDGAQAQIYPLRDSDAS